MRTKRTQITRPLWIAFLAIMTFSGTARAWWNSEWTLRKKITLDASAAGAGITDPIGTTPVLIRLHDGNFQFLNAKDDGSDIRFVAGDDKTPFVFHVEKFDPVLNEAFVWVKVPNVKPGGKTTLWLYYGNSGGKAVKADDPTDGDAARFTQFAAQGRGTADRTRACR